MNGQRCIGDVWFVAGIAVMVVVFKLELLRVFADLLVCLFALQLHVTGLHVRI